MVLPIYAYGHPVLKKMGKDIDKDYPELDKLIENMWETMANARGVGLAAPQIGLAIRLFIIDSTLILEDDDETDEKGLKQVFINAKIIEEGGAPWDYEEGCLSIPDIRAEVRRPAQVKLEFYDAKFKKHTKVFTGTTARVIQHEYDHIDGILFTELIKPLKKRLYRKKLEKIKKGNIKVSYRMKFVR